MGVIANHAMSPAARETTFAAFDVMQAVPVFVVLMGLNAKRSLDRRWPDASPRAAYPFAYVRGRVGRLLVPFAVAAAASAIVGFSIGLHPAVGLQTLLLRLPFPFRGNFFVPLGVLLAAVAPLVYVAYRRAPRLTVAASVALSAGYEFVAPLVLPASAYFVYQIDPLRFVGLFAVGFWLADGEGLTLHRNRLVLPAAAVSMLFLAAASVGWRPYFVGPEYMYNVLGAGWAVALSSAGLTYLPAASTNPALALAARVGRASYHIFLVQAVWFLTPASSMGTAAGIVVGVAVSCTVGLAWHALEGLSARTSSAWQES